MKTIEDAVIEFNGIWPEQAKDSKRFIVLIKKLDGSHSELKLDKDKFEAEAKRLGCINGYRWGVEYPTNGKRPELEDDVLVDMTHSSGHIYRNWIESWHKHNGITSFKVIDERYKPADTSYLNIEPQDHIVEANEMVSDWWDYDKLQAKSGKLIPVGSDVLFFDRAPNHFKCKVMYSSEYVTVIRCIDGSVNKEMIGVDISRCPFEENFNQIKPLDWNRKAELDREKVIEAAIKISSGGLVKEMYSALYNAGMLVLPPNKSDTKD